ncbi:MAG: ABC transporter permease [Deltaproteobacteria bacterium]|nr:ABC transporter permease [Deltaproteobacteria bacterium]
MSKSNSNTVEAATSVSEPVEAETRKSESHIIQYGIFVVFAIYYLIVAILRPGFISLGNLYDIFTETAIISFVSFGEAIVIAAGGLDLSVGNAAGAAAMLTCHLMSNLGYDTWVSIVAGVAIGGVIGVGNGLMVTRLHMNSLIATLGTMFVLVGFLYGVTGGVSVHIVPDDFMYLGTGTILSAPVPIWVMAVVFVIAYLFMEKTSYGRSITMIGGNIEACRLSGVNIRRLTMLTFVICGFLSTFSGILLAARQAVGNVDLGERFLLEGFIAAMLGTVIFNGKNIITGTLIGAIFLISMINGLTLLGAGPQWMYFAQGALLLMAIMANYYSKRFAAKIT